MPDTIVQKFGKPSASRWILIIALEPALNNEVVDLKSPYNCPRTDWSVQSCSFQVREWDDLIRAKSHIHKLGVSNQTCRHTLRQVVANDIRRSGGYGESRCRIGNDRHLEINNHLVLTSGCEAIR
jgi:hypothetical protein